MANTMTPTGMRKFGLVFAGFAGLFMIIGGGMAWNQVQRMYHAVPVAATVLSSRLDSQHGSKGGTTWAPVVEYSYRVTGREYRCSDVSPMTVYSSGRDAAEAVLQRFPVGAQVQAWHDRDDPASAFLLREVAFFPYIFILFPLIHFSVGLGMFLGSGCRERQTSTTPVWGTLAVVWGFTTVVCLGHYAGAGGACDAIALVGFGIALAISLGLGLVWLLLRSRTVATP